MEVYPIAYLALHGSQGRVSVGNARIDLERLVVWSGPDETNGEIGWRPVGAEARNGEPPPPPEGP